MQRRLWAFPLIVLLAGTTLAALADEDWDEDNAKGTAALQDGKYKEAEKAFLAARKDSEKSASKYGHYATTLLNLGQVYDKTGKVQESESAYKEALNIYQKSYGMDSAEDGRALQGLAETFRHHNKYTEALPLFQRALKIRNVLIPTHPDTAETLNGLADVYRHQGKNNDALPLYQRALAIRKEAFGATHPKVAKSLDNLSQTYAALGKYDMAVPIYKDLVSARQTTVGLEDPKVAQALEDLGYAYGKTDKAKKAEISFKQALAIREKQAKQDPAALSACNKRYAEFLRSIGRKDDAAKLDGKAAATKAAPAAVTKGAPAAATKAVPAAVTNGAPAAATKAVPAAVTKGAPAATGGRKPAPGKTASK
jgi:tetratricopeptide (TPR) repeat protein